MHRVDKGLGFTVEASAIGGQWRGDGKDNKQLNRNWGQECAYRDCWIFAK